MEASQKRDKSPRLLRQGKYMKTSHFFFTLKNTLTSSKVTVMTVIQQVIKYETYDMLSVPNLIEKLQFS